MTAFDPTLAARIASSGAPLSADLVQDTDRMTAEREAEILKFRDDCHPVTGILAAARVHDALADLVADLAAVRKERDEARAWGVEVVEYGVRVPGSRWPEEGVLRDGDTFDRADQEARLERVCDSWVNAELVQRIVRRGEWTEATS